MTTLVTGATGFVGRALIPKLLSRGEQVVALVRDKDKALLPEGVIVVEGDILKPNLGVDRPLSVDKLIHLAAIHQLGENNADKIWETNVDGTINVVSFCNKYNIKHLIFCSTAYTQGRNPYERSKSVCELLVRESDIPKKTIFKPSIIMGTAEQFYPGHFAQFVTLIIKIHQRAEIVRRKIEGTLRLPIIEPVFRLRANPAGKLNLVPIDAVVSAMAEIEEPGTFWLTHPDPPTLSDLVEWVGSFIMVKINIEPTFRATPVEALFSKMSDAFTPYLWGDDFPSDLKKCPPITEEFITSAIKRSL